MADLPTVEMWKQWHVESVAKRYDTALARLRRTVIRRLIAEYAERGIVLTVRDGVLCRNRDASIVNGTAQRIEAWKAWIIEVLSEAQ